MTDGMTDGHVERDADYWRGRYGEIKEKLAKANDEIDRAHAAVRVSSNAARDSRRRYDRAQNALERIDRRYRAAEHGHAGLAFDLYLIANKALAPDEEEPADKSTCNTDEGCDKKGTAFDRDSGFMCRRCGVKTESKFTGNTLICYSCPKCGDEIDP